MAGMAHPVALFFAIFVSLVTLVILYSIHEAWQNFVKGRMCKCSHMTKEHDPAGRCEECACDQFSPKGMGL